MLGCGLFPEHWQFGPWTFHSSSALRGPARRHQIKIPRKGGKLAAEAVCRFPAIASLLTKPLNKEARTYVKALRTYPEIPARFKKRKRQPSLAPVAEDWLDCEAHQFFTDSEANWPSDDLFRDLGGLMMGSIL